MCVCMCVCACPSGYFLYLSEICFISVLSVLERNQTENVSLSLIGQFHHRLGGCDKNLLLSRMRSKLKS